MLLDRGIRREESEEGFDAAVYCLRLRTPVDEVAADEVRFGITGNIPGESGWSPNQRDFAIDLAEYELKQDEMNGFLKLPASQQVVPLSFFLEPRHGEDTPGAAAYRQSHMKRTLFPLLPTLNGGRKAVIESALYALHDLEKVRQHTTKTRDIVVSVTVKLLTEGDIDQIDDASKEETDEAIREFKREFRSRSEREL